MKALSSKSWAWLLGSAVFYSWDNSKELRAYRSKSGLSSRHCCLPSSGTPQNLFLFQPALRHSLDELCVVMEAVVSPDPGTEEEASREESPLLSSGVDLNKEPVTCNELLHLVPEGPPEVRSNILPW